MLRIGYKPAFLRQFRKLPAVLQDEVEERIALFQTDPRNPALRTHKLKGVLEGKWSFSVNYAYRIVFLYEDKHTAVLLAVGDHAVYG
jgi:mRNA interferase YafQ